MRWLRAGVHQPGEEIAFDFGAKASPRRGEIREPDVGLWFGIDEVLDENCHSAIRFVDLEIAAPFQNDLASFVNSGATAGFAEEPDGQVSPHLRGREDSSRWCLHVAGSRLPTTADGVIASTAVREYFHHSSE